MADGKVYNNYWMCTQLAAMIWDHGYAIFYYDASGAPYAVRNYDGWLDKERTYLYITNLQGDGGTHRCGKRSARRFLRV